MRKPHHPVSGRARIFWTSARRTPSKSHFNDWRNGLTFGVPNRGLYDKPATSTLTGKMVFPLHSSFIDPIARRDKLRVLVDGMTAANDLGLTTAVPARSTVYADTYPRTIEIEANAGDPTATKPVIYTLDFKRIAAKTAIGPAGHADRSGAQLVS